MKNLKKVLFCLFLVNIAIGMTTSCKNPIKPSVFEEARGKVWKLNGGILLEDGKDTFLLFENELNYYKAIKQGDGTLDVKKYAWAEPPSYNLSGNTLTIKVRITPFAIAQKVESPTADEIKETAP